MDIEANVAATLGVAQQQESKPAAEQVALLERGMLCAERGGMHAQHTLRYSLHVLLSVAHARARAWRCVREHALCALACLCWPPVHFLCATGTGESKLQPLMPRPCSGLDFWAAPPVTPLKKPL